MPKLKYINLKPFPPQNSTIEINTDEHYYDLHNMADFVSVFYNPEKRIVELVWKYPGELDINNILILTKNIKEKMILERKKDFLH